jgi:hypothetical protein
MYGLIGKMSATAGNRTPGVIFSPERERCPAA